MAIEQNRYFAQSSLFLFAPYYEPGAVEVFMKIRQRDPAHRADRYMLLTFEEPPGNVKAGWKESHATFMHELKNLQGKGLSGVKWVPLGGNGSRPLFPGIRGKCREF